MTYALKNQPGILNIAQMIKIMYFMLISYAMAMILMYLKLVTFVIN